MARLRRKRSQMMMPRRKRAGPAEPKNEQSVAPKQQRRRFDFHFFVDVTTLLASIATVITLVYLIHDRRDQANIVAWTLLQNYLQQEPRPKFNEGQDFAFETLVRNGVPLFELDAHDAVFTSASLHGLIASGASFKRAQLGGLDLSNATLEASDFEGASIGACQCLDADFTRANLVGASLEIGGNYHGARFDQADISDLEFPKVVKVSGINLNIHPPLPRLDADAFISACYRLGHPPRLSNMNISLPADPQGKACMDQWGKAWAVLERP